MITTAEVIAWFENRLAGITMPGARRMYEQALTILRAQQECENPESLTLEELREMDGEPVWIIAGNVSWWDIVFSSNKEWLYLMREKCLPLSRYGDWLAYRHKPEEGTI